MNACRLLPLIVLAILSGCESYDYVNTRSSYYRGAPRVEYDYPINYAPYPYYTAPYYGSGSIGLYDYPVPPAYGPVYMDRYPAGPMVAPPPRQIEVPQSQQSPQSIQQHQSHQRIQGTPWRHLDQLRRHGG